MDSIEQHIAKDKEILDNPNTSPQARRHIEGELHDLEDWVEHHKEEIEAGDHHDPHHLSSTVIKNQALQSAKFMITKYG